MFDWGTFEDEGASSPSAQDDLGAPARTSQRRTDAAAPWGTFQDEAEVAQETEADEEYADGNDPWGSSWGAGGKDPWGTFHDDEPGRTGSHTGTDGTVGPSHSSGSGGPSAEATASLLRAGNVLWAKVDSTGAVLGSGTRLRIPGGVPDRLYGWRPVEITDPATLAAQVVAVESATPPAGRAAPLASLFRADPVQQQASPQRPAAFPVGQGPDVRALLQQRLAAAEQEVLQRAEAAERQAEARASHAEATARSHIVEAQRQHAAALQAADSRASDWQHAANTAAQTAEAAKAQHRIELTLARRRTGYAVGVSVALLILLIVVLSR